MLIKVTAMSVVLYSHFQDLPAARGPGVKMLTTWANTVKPLIVCM